MSAPEDMYLDVANQPDPPEPAGCEQGRHELASTVECIHCGLAFYPTETEGTT